MNRPGSPSPTLEECLDAYRTFLNAPESVSEAWRSLFTDLDDEARAWLASALAPDGSSSSDSSAPAGNAAVAARDSMNAMRLIRSYRVRGHLEANLDPLRLVDRPPHPELDPETYGFTSADRKRAIQLDGLLGLESASINEIESHLRRAYCGTLAVEFMHLQDPEEVAWIRDQFEASPDAALKSEQRRVLLEHLTAAEGFEKFIDAKWKGAKRFGLDGGESTIPALEQIVCQGAATGVEEIVIGMPHRGRLSVLANIMAKPLDAIFAEFRGLATLPDDTAGSGDVKYHLGTSSDRLIDGKKMHLSLVPNPSHLEAVDPVVLGKVRARQDQIEDHERTKCLGILLHGDAAFAGQGLVGEVLLLSELEGYRTGGTIHLIVNNQIGFTTNPVASRSGPYCSDVAMGVQAPIFHVNGDDPEAVLRAASLALSFRQKFHRDVVIDLFCYRRHGHNEGDEPGFTQPRMVAAIRGHETTRALYAARLAEEGVLTTDETNAIVAQGRKVLEDAFEASESYQPKAADWLGANWSGLEPVKGYDARRGSTAVPLETLEEIGRVLLRVPEHLNVHKKIYRLLKAKNTMFDTGHGFDWATAEALAFGSLLIEGHHVRLSGEDVNRGTFSHRHASWIDQNDESRFVPLEHLRPQQGRCEIVNSPLSEFGVLGYEYGYAMAEPSSLVIWEAQFGDFANGAQVIIDQFIAAGESKWLRMNGLVLLLPHGFEGQGPEHSSARLERFLQLCAEDNLQVLNCTTPANYFHALRRQLHRTFRKPLIVMSPKSLLRNKRCVSPLSAMGPGSEFHRVLHCDSLPSRPDEAKQVVLCTGKVYYDLLEAREAGKRNDVHFLRIEQLYPFPADALAEMLAPYRHCHLVWCQEEPRNQGAWEFISPMISEIAEAIGCEHPEIRYAGRATAASPATGLHDRHAFEQKALVEDALTIGRAPLGRLASRRQNAREIS